MSLPLAGCEPIGSGAEASAGRAGAISLKPGAVASMLSGVVGTMFDGSAGAAPEAATTACGAAANAAAVRQVSEAVVSTPDWAETSALENSTSSIAASDAPKA